MFRVENNKFRAPFASGITNATSLAFSPDGRLHVSSRFEGVVYSVGDNGTSESVVSDLGVACGLVFSSDGTLYVGDRSGTIFRVSTSGQSEPFATLPASVAAFHLAEGPDGCLYIIDMYRGVIQESNWVRPGSYLYEEILRKKLHKNVQRGRIYRISKDGVKPDNIPKFDSFSNDQSWDNEINYFVSCIINNKKIIEGNSHQAFNTMKLIFEIYYSDIIWRKKYSIQNPKIYNIDNI